jgi:hypothetical protein
MVVLVLGHARSPHADNMAIVIRAAAQYACTAQEAAVTGVVRGVLMTRPGADGAHGGTLQELVRRLPGELFRTCLARVSPLPPLVLGAGKRAVPRHLECHGLLPICRQPGLDLNVAMQDVSCAHCVATCHHLARLTPSPSSACYISTRCHFFTQIAWSFLRRLRVWPGHSSTINGCISHAQSEQTCPILCIH